jgi:hypothetical protein
MAGPGLRPDRRDRTVRQSMTGRRVDVLPSIPALRPVRAARPARALPRRVRQHIVHRSIIVHQAGNLTVQSIRVRRMSGVAAGIMLITIITIIHTALTYSDRPGIRWDFSSAPCLPGQRSSRSTI